ncbi:MAG: hypothetical protein N3E37_04515 [Candidatus Micrarchaeota archaeon]|nr:hypothetical protein [Candidatus Micrarchaeota archaeon]
MIFSRKTFDRQDIEDRLEEHLDTLTDDFIKYLWGSAFLKILKTKGKGSKIEQKLSKIKKEIYDEYAIRLTSQETIMSFFSIIEKFLSSSKEYFVPSFNLPLVSLVKWETLGNRLTTYFRSAYFKSHITNITYENLNAFSIAIYFVYVVITFVLSMLSEIKAINEDTSQSEEEKNKKIFDKVFEQIFGLINSVVSAYYSYPLLRIISKGYLLDVGRVESTKVKYTVYRPFEIKSVLGDYQQGRTIVFYQGQNTQGNKILASYPDKKPPEKTEQIIQSNQQAQKNTNITTIKTYMNIKGNLYKFFSNNEELNLSILENIGVNLLFYGSVFGLLTLLYVFEKETTEDEVNIMVTTIDKALSSLVQIIKNSYTITEETPPFSVQTYEKVVYQPFSPKVLSIFKRLLQLERILPILFQTISGGIYSITLSEEDRERELRKIETSFYKFIKSVLYEHIIPYIGITQEVKRFEVNKNMVFDLLSIRNEYLKPINENKDVVGNSFYQKVIDLQDGVNVTTTTYNKNANTYISNNPTISEYFATYSVANNVDGKQTLKKSQSYIEKTQNFGIGLDIPLIYETFVPIFELVPVHPKQVPSIPIYFIDYEKLKDIVPESTYEYYTDNYSINLFGSAVRIKHINNRVQLTLSFTLVNPYILLGDYMQNYSTLVKLPIKKEQDLQESKTPSVSEYILFKITPPSSEQQKSEALIRKYLQTFLYLLSHSTLLKYNLSKEKDIDGKLQNKINLHNNLLYSYNYSFLNTVYEIKFEYVEKLFNEFYKIFFVGDEKVSEKRLDFSEDKKIAYTFIDNLVYRQNPSNYSLGDEKKFQGVKRRFVPISLSVSSKINPENILILTPRLYSENKEVGLMDGYAAPKVLLFYDVVIELQEVFVGF